MSRLFALVVFISLSGCALLGKSDPVVPRYFTPIDDSPNAQPAQALQPRAANLKLHLGRIEGLSSIKELLAIRISPQELSYRDGERWTERPEVYVRTLLAQALFQQRSVIEVMSGRSITLDVELTSFEEIEKPQDVVRVQLFFVLHDDHQALSQDSIVLDVQVPQGANASGDQHAPAVVAAYSSALRSTVSTLADRVVAKLGEAAAAQ